MRGWMWIGALGILLGCGAQASADGDCEAVCQQLVHTCAYAAFPTYDSCVQGCAHNGEQGADIRAQRTCFEEAECDTFAIVECEHSHGLD